MTKTFTFPIAQATAILGALQRVAPLQDEQGRPKPIPAVFSYALIMDAMKLSGVPEVAAAETERVNLIRKYGTVKPNGDVELSPANFPAFSSEWDPIGSRHVSVELEMLPAGLREHVAMIPQDMVMLMPLWEEVTNGATAAALSRPGAA